MIFNKLRRINSFAKSFRAERRSSLPRLSNMRMFSDGRWSCSIFLGECPSGHSVYRWLEFLEKLGVYYFFGSSEKGVRIYVQ